MKSENNPKNLPAGRINSRICLIRGHKVMLDSDLALLYGVSTKALTQAVKRNRNRFPGDFMYQLSRKEVAILRSQFVTSSWGGKRYLPYAFTEQGIAMLSSVLKSDRAIQVNIEIMRAFVRLRQILASHADLARKLDALENKYDAQFKAVFDAIRNLMSRPPIPDVPKRKIGFHNTAQVSAGVFDRAFKRGVAVKHLDLKTAKACYPAIGKKRT